MLNFVVLAHEEGVSTGTNAWAGPLVFFGIVLISVVIAKFIKRREVKSNG